VPTADIAWSCALTASAARRKDHGYRQACLFHSSIRRNWQVFWPEPDGATGSIFPVSARTVEQAYEVVQELHPGAPVSAIDADQLDPKWMPGMMMDWLRDWEDDYTP